MAAGSYDEPDSPVSGSTRGHWLRLCRVGIDTYQEPVVYMRRSCPVCRSEGFEAQSRVQIELGERRIVATLNVVDGELVGHGEAGLSESAWRLLGAREGEAGRFSHPAPIESMAAVRAKIYGHHLEDGQIRRIVEEIVAGSYSQVEIAGFVAACGGDHLDQQETEALTRAMLEVGERLDWGRPLVADKHCVGGLPGNRTTPILVAIAAASGLIMPKTSSRAITSPAGTADVMEVIAPVALDVAAMRRVVEQEGACIVWGEAVGLSPADDALIRVERVLDLDSEGQLVASVLSKKIAAGATHVVIDVPVGATAKVRSEEAAGRLLDRMTRIGLGFGLAVHAVLTDGSQPVGRGIGPALEARDVLAVLERAPQAPADLRERSLALAARLLELCGAAAHGAGLEVATRCLDDGSAWKKFRAICVAQGGFREPPRAAFVHDVLAEREGRVESFDNRRLARAAKLAGAPLDSAAGIELHVRRGDRVRSGDRLFTLHAEAEGELAYALDYVRRMPQLIALEAG